MTFKSCGNNIFFLLLIFLCFTLILSQNENCTSILHCHHCPDIKRCEICDTGYKLALELDRCIPENESYSQNQGVSAQAIGSSQNCTNTTSNESLSSNISLASKPPIAQNAPVASNNPMASNAKDTNQGLSLLERTNSSGGSSLKICICIVVVISVICIIYLCIRKKKGKASYFYDESGNPDEKAKVVYIK